MIGQKRGVEFEVQFLAGDLENKQLPDLFPRQCKSLLGSRNRPSMLLHSGTILICGGGIMKQCYQLIRGAWQFHSILNESRLYHSAVSTQNAIFIFGGEDSRNTYEYLPKESSKWLMGKAEIPGGFQGGCAIAVKSEQEIWLIGDHLNGKRILQFNVNDHTFKVMPFKLIVDHIFLSRCALIPNTNKVMILDRMRGFYAQIVDIENGSVNMTGPLMSTKQHDIFFRQMDVLKINGEDRLAVFGGLHRDWILDPITPKEYLDTIELYNSQTNKWETTNKTFNGEQHGFGFLKIKLSDIIPELRCSVDYFRFQISIFCLRNEHQFFSDKND